jgi:hypothetical protein
MQYQSSALGHNQAALTGYANQQQHLNNAYLSGQQAIGSLIQGGFSVANMGIANSYAARSAQAAGLETKGPGWLSGGGNTWW